jgi:hypothetical protein
MGLPTLVGTNQVFGILQQKRIELLVEHLLDNFIVATDEDHHRIISHDESAYRTYTSSWSTDIEEPDDTEREGR